MITRFFTIVSEFRGTTDVRQVFADDESGAVRAWVSTFRDARPFGRASAYLAKSIESDQDTFPPVALQGVENVWCFNSSCGGDFMLANIIETVISTKGG
jgi:hypothetical protein